MHRAPLGRRWAGCESLAHLRADANRVREAAYIERRGEIDNDLTRRHEAGQAIQRALRERPIPRHRALVPIQQVTE